MRKAKAHAIAATDDYLKMIQVFPLRRLRNEDEHVEATKVLSRLLGGESQVLSQGERDYAGSLALLVTEYDNRVYPFPRGRGTPLRALRQLMEQNEMNTEALGKILGNKTAASLVLNGKRELSKAHIRKLASRFKVDPGLFF